MNNVQTVQEIYGAFGRGDIPAILDKLAPDVAWDDDAAGDEVPFLVARRGKDDVAGFFQSLAAAEFTRFEPTAFLESDNIVVALLNVTFNVKATGKTVAMDDEVHIWRFGPDGKVSTFRHRVDTLAHQRAFAK